MKRAFFKELLYWVLGLTFAVAAIVKLRDPEAFLSSLLTYRVFPLWLAGFLVYFGPILELLVALCLFARRLRAGAKLLSLSMLLLFIALVAQGYFRGLELDCGCFGSNQLLAASDYLLKLGQNVLLIAVLGAAHSLESHKKIN
ncbi:MauE/DoxX family redox-associated membrane protein [Pelagicoccus albus]|uniref:Methylamine utilisation protein MauE domain-containing protein n=1 Tax=Pelagicoccus albus TaxID=415222 RepID=A0A7X1B7R4_9BACT|nr:MauE/DoxX family redox-associated membrane protein [Pelagicoccus albus]MBC2606969.1 hypothetical protein [Pelagicoccus albus]